MLLSFQRPPHPRRRGLRLPNTPLHMRKASVEAQHCSPSFGGRLCARRLRGLVHPKGHGSIALRRRNVTRGRRSALDRARKRTKRRLPTCSTAPSRRSTGTSSWSLGKRLAVDPHPALAPAVAGLGRRNAERARAAAPAGEPRRRRPAADARRSRQAARARRADGRSAPRPPVGGIAPRGSARPAIPRASARLDSTGGTLRVERAVEQQVVVDRHRRVGDAHQLAEDLLGRLGDADVVARATSTSAGRRRSPAGSASSGPTAAALP